MKILSVDPRNYPDAPSEAIRQVLQKYYGAEIPRGSKLDLADVGKYFYVASLDSAEIYKTYSNHNIRMGENGYYCRYQRPP